MPLPEFLSKKIDSQCIGNQFGTLFTLPYKAEPALSSTESGYRVYSDYVERTVNIVQNTNIREVVKLKEWIPRFAYCTSSGDLLVFMDNDDD